MGKFIASVDDAPRYGQSNSGPAGYSQAVTTTSPDPGAGARPARLSPQDVAARAVMRRCPDQGTEVATAASSATRPTDVNSPTPADPAGTQSGAALPDAVVLAAGVGAGIPAGMAVFGALVPYVGNLALLPAMVVGGLALLATGGALNFAASFLGPKGYAPTEGGG